MKRASIRDLRYRFPEVERLLRAGETVEITRRGELVARLTPAHPAGPGATGVPDIMKRLRSIYGSRVMAVSGAELLRQDRGNR